MKVVVMISLLVGSVVQAQGYYSERMIGNTRYGTGEINGQRIDTRSRQIGRFQYDTIDTNGSNGNQQVNCTSFWIGNTKHTNCY